MHFTSSEPIKCKSACFFPRLSDRIITKLNGGSEDNFLERITLFSQTLYNFSKSTPSAIKVKKKSPPHPHLFNFPDGARCPRKNSSQRKEKTTRKISNSLGQLSRQIRLPGRWWEYFNPHPWPFSKSPFGENPSEILQT